MKKERLNIFKRVVPIYILVALFASAIIGRTAYIQFSEGKELIKQAEEQVTEDDTLFAIRGNILSADGSLMAVSVPFYELRMDVASPNISDKLFNENIDSLSIRLSNLFKDKPASRYKQELVRARQAERRYFLIQEKVSFTQMKEVREMPLFRKGRYRGGIIEIPYTVRERPYDPLAMRTIGYYFPNNKNNIGIETAYNEELQGSNGRITIRKMSNGDWMPIYDESVILPTDGNDVVTTIDLSIQDVTEKALDRAITENRAWKGCALVMDVRSGEIKAIANLIYDSVKQDYQESSNLAIGMRYEPGSTFKLVSMMAALESGQVSPSDIIDTEKGRKVWFGRTMEDDHVYKEGFLTVKEVLEQSSNVGTSKIVYSIFRDQPEKFLETTRRLKLDTLLGFEIEGEWLYKNNTLKSTRNWSATTLPWISIGYEVTVNPLHLLTVYNAVANNGVMVKPIVVKEVQRGGVTVRKIDTQVIEEEICSPKTIKVLRSMLEGVVERGTAKNLKNLPFKVAGKTGTAKFTGPSGTYLDGGYNASFVGYFPAEEPVYSCLVVVTRPKAGKIYGGEVAAPVFAEIALGIYGCNLDLAGSRRFAVPDSLKSPIAYTGERESLEKIFKNTGYKITKVPESYEWITVQQKPFSIKARPVSQERLIMPKLTGMTVKDVIQYMESYGMEVTFKGRGWVEFQYPAPGDTLRGTEEPWVMLSTTRTNYDAIVADTAATGDH